MSRLLIWIVRWLALIVRDIELLDDSLDMLNGKKAEVLDYDYWKNLELDMYIDEVIPYEKANSFCDTFDYRIMELNRAMYLLKEDIKNEMTKFRIKI